MLLHHTAPPYVYTLSLHDALPIFQGLFELADLPYVGAGVLASAVGMDKAMMKAVFAAHGLPIVEYLVVGGERSEEHTSELQSQSNLVCRLLLEKTKTIRPRIWQAI